MEQLSITFPKHLALLSPDELYDSASSQLLSFLAEDKRIERKPPGVHPSFVSAYFSMWANTLPDGGLIVVGIEDDGKISGCHKLSSGQLNDLEKSPFTHCPDAKVRHRRVAATAADGNSSFIVLFRVDYRQDKVIRNHQDEAFIRHGDSKHKLTDAEIRELEIDKRQVDIEKEAQPTVYPDEFDSELLRKFFEGVKKRHQPLQHHSDIDVLQHRRLGTIKDGVFTPNTACVLAFGKDPVGLFPGCQIRFLRIDGEVEQSGRQYNIIKTIPLEGPVPRLLQQADEVLTSQLRDFSRWEGEAFYAAPEYPRDAWYEALVNACVHRSYGLKNMNIFVKMFDDKLVIESPGGFPPLVTPENIYTMHHPRNPTLMRAMFYLDLVKEHSEGTKRMRDEMSKMNLPEPIFEQTKTEIGNATVRVTLRNLIKQRKVWVDSDVSSLLGEALSRNLTREEKRILNFVAEHEKINVVQCHRLLPGLAKWHSAKKLLIRLVDKGLLKRVTTGTKLRSRAYFVLPPAFQHEDKNEGRNKTRK